MIYQSDGVRVDTASFRVERDGAPCDLEPKAFDLLVFLLRHAGRVVTKTEILDQVWGGVAVTDNALTRVVAQLRRALGDDARESRFIETVPTRGYRWLPEVAVEEARPPAIAARGDDSFAEAEPSESATTVAEAARDAVAVEPAHRRYRAWVIGAAAAVLVLAIAVAWWARAGSPRAVTVRLTAPFPVQVTTDRALDLFPTPSPDGQSIIYASDRSGAFELYLRPLVRGASETQLTSDGSGNVEAAWSPDGQRVAFHSIRRGGIWVMPALGGTARQVVAFGSAPTWSPDGRTLAFQSDPLGDLGPVALGARPGSTIWVVAVDGPEAARALTRPNQPAGGHASPIWTRDGASVLFIDQTNTFSALWAVDVRDGSARRLSPFGATVFDPTFAADGRRLFTTAGGPGVWAIEIDPRARAATGSVTQIALPGVESVRFVAPTTGGRILFSGITLDSELVALPIGPAGEPAGPPRVVTNSAARRTTAPVVSPDGEWIAYVSGARGAAADIWVTRLDGSGTEPVTTSPEPDMRPAWFPDNDALSFLSSRNGVRGIWKTSRTSHRESLLERWPPSGVDASEALEEPRISADGTRIAYGTVDGATGREELHVRIRATGADRVVAVSDEGASYPCWSPDGRLIAFEAKRNGSSQIGIVPADGGPVRLLTDTRGEHWVHSFSPDGSKVVSADLENGVWNIAWTSIVDGTRRVVTAYRTPGTFVRYPAWSPRGDTIVFEEARLRANIWMADLAHPAAP